MKTISFFLPVQMVVTLAVFTGQAFGQVLQPVYDLAKLPGSAADAPSTLIYGAQVGEQSGSIIRTADLNGDGVDDLIVSAPMGRVAGPVVRISCGAVYVWFGKTAFGGIKDALGTVGSAPDVAIYGASPSDFCTRYGSLAVGDVNGDGTADLLLGAEEGRGPGDAKQSSGEAYVVLGRKAPATFPAVIDLSVQGPGGADLTIYAGSAFDYMSQHAGIKAGDVNGDGADDILLGAFAGDGPTGPTDDQRGEAYIILGRKSPAVFPTTLDLNLQGSGGADVTIYGASGRIFEVTSTGDQLTADGAITTGDLNGDGVLDLLLGAYVAHGPGDERSAAGEAYIIYGRKSPTAFPLILDLAVKGSGGADVTIYGGFQGGMLTINRDASRRGASMVKGDFNGDGTTDLIVSAAGVDGAGGAQNRGEAYLIFGRKAPGVFSDTVDLGLRDGSWGVIFNGASPQDGMGIVPGSVGDFNGDGVDDFILTSFNADGPGELRNAAGEAYIIFGRRSPATFPPVTYVGGVAGAPADVTIQGANTGDLLTVYGAVATGDLNGDGVDDLALGATEADGPAEGRTQAGEAYVIFGRRSPSVFPATIDLAATGGLGANILIYGGGAANRLTAEGAIAIQDVNGDGAGDLLMGAPGASGPAGGRALSGRSYVIQGLRSTPPVPLRFTGFSLTVPPVGGAGWRVQAEVSGGAAAVGMVLDFQASENLANWTTIGTLTLNGTGVGTIDIVDGFTGSPRYYRALRSGG